MMAEEVINESQLELLPLPKGNFYGIAVSPNGRYLCAAVRCPDTGSQIIIWDIHKEKIVKAFKTIMHARYLAVSPDNKYIAAKYHGSIDIYNFNGETVNTISPDLAIAHFAWRPNGKHIAIATYEPYLLVANAFERRRMRCWEYPLHCGEYLDRTFGVAWHPKGKRLASLHEYGLTIHEMPYLKIVRHDENEYVGGGKPPLTYSPDGKYIAFKLDTVLIADGETLELLPEEQFPYSGGGNITSYDWRVQRYITISTTSNKVFVWNFERSETEKVWAFKFKKYTYPEQVLMHPNGKTIFAMYMEHGIATLNI